MKRSGDVIIVGGGVIGLTTAYFLAREGTSVVLCESGKTGMESSWAGAGILPPSHLEHAQLPHDRLRAISGDLFPGLSQELRERTGIDNGFVRCGGIEFLDAADESDEWYGLGAAKKTLSAAETIALEPALAADVGPALHLPDMAQLRNPRHMQALRAACVATNQVTILEAVSAREFLVEGNRVKGLRTSGEVLHGDHFLVAAGAWTSGLLESLGCRLRIEPIRGQIVLLNPGRHLFRHILIQGVRYLVPRLDGRVLIGSTEEHAGFDKSTTPAGVNGLLELGRRLVPALGDAAVERTWAGLRPGSADGLPYIGQVPGMDNVIVAAGHFRAGIQLSVGTALLVKEMIRQQPPTMPVDAFRLDR